MRGTPDLTTRLRAWTYRRQALDVGVGSARDALRAVVAVYSSHPSAPLSLLARRPALDADELRALEAGRAAVRIPAMRGSIFLAPIETAGRLLAATRPPLAKLLPSLRYAGLDADAYARLKPRVLDALAEPRAPDALREVPGLGERATVAVRTMAREGLVLRLSTGLRSDSLRYVATAAWLGGPLEEADPDASLAWLAGAYLRAFGPARVADVAWWAGVPRRRATAALAAVATADLGGGLLLPAEDREAFERAGPLPDDALALLPKWDAYTMGHAPDGRARLIEDAHLPLAYTLLGKAATSGDGLPLVLVGGRAVASWSHRFAGDRLRVVVRPFDPSCSLPPLDAGFAEVGRLLGATSVEAAVAAPGG